MDSSEAMGRDGFETAKKFLAVSMSNIDIASKTISLLNFTVCKIFCRPSHFSQFVKYFIYSTIFFKFINNYKI